MKSLLPTCLALFLPFQAFPADEPTLAKLERYVTQFNADDAEIVRTDIPNAEALAFLAENIPRFDCPNQDMERTYYFRWWTFRKHLASTSNGWVITEFLHPVPWAGPHNTINCANGHHLREARWLKDRRYAEDCARYWLRREARIIYSSWLPEAVLAVCAVTGDTLLAREWLPDLLRHYRNWETSRLDAKTGLYWQNDSGDGMEGSISGGGFRPTINSYMFANANAIARVADLEGKPELAREYRDKAATLKARVLDRLWNEERGFFEVRRGPQPSGLFGVRVNGDPELTSRARVTSSSKRDPTCLARAEMPRSSWHVQEPHLAFQERGTLQWVHYEFPSPIEVSQLEAYLTRLSMRPEFPESARVLHRQNGEWREVTGARGALDAFDRWNLIRFDPVTTDAVRLELRLGGFTREALPFRNVRELLGYTPWMFGLAEPRHAVAWKHFTDPEGFAAPWGLTTAERRHPEFQISYTRHECLWNGPVWPFATAQTLTALANLLNGAPQPFVQKADYFAALRQYARSHRLTLSDGRVIPWIDENQNPFDGDWIARTRLRKNLAEKPAAAEKKGPADRGDAYNHSTYCDLVITGLVGLRPREDDQVEVNPLVPGETWDWFCLDRVPYHGRLLTIRWDKDGTRYGQGAGLQVLADGRPTARSDQLGKITGRLP